MKRTGAVGGLVATLLLLAGGYKVSTWLFGTHLADSPAAAVSAYITAIQRGNLDLASHLADFEGQTVSQNLVMLQGNKNIEDVISFTAPHCVVCTATRAVVAVDVTQRWAGTLQHARLSLSAVRRPEGWIVYFPLHHEKNR